MFTRHSLFVLSLLSLCATITAIRIDAAPLAKSTFQNLTLGLMPQLSYPASRNRYFKYWSHGFVGNSGQDGLDWKLNSNVNWMSRNGVLGPIQNQQNCNSGWAMAATSSVESLMYLYTKFYVQLSSQQIMDCNANVSGSCGAGFPSNAFDFMYKNSVVAESTYPYLGLNQSCFINNYYPFPIKSFKISMFEEIYPENFGALGLILALQNQPIVVNIQASEPVFRSYTGGILDDENCFTDIVDHSVLLVGYNLNGAKPHWTIQNSWGSSWGEGGYVRMAFSVGVGICGIHSTPALYPVLPFIFGGCKNPNPCGTGACSINPTNGKNVCTCTSGFVAITNIDGTQGCAPLYPCQMSLYNPCGSGTCVNDLNGDYHCICPSGFNNTQFAYRGGDTCLQDLVPQNKTLYTSKKKDTCEFILTTFGLTQADFLKQNSMIDCSKEIPEKSTFNVSQSLPKKCASSYTWSCGDTCASVANLLQISVTQLTDYNPGLDCQTIKPGQLVCAQTGNDFKQNRMCTQHVPVKGSNSCANLIKASKLRPDEFFSMNEGLNCNSLANSAAKGKLNSLLTQEVCTNSVLISPTTTTTTTTTVTIAATTTCSFYVTVTSTMTCTYILTRYFTTGGLTQFRCCNPTLACGSLKVGVRVCVCPC